MKMHQSMRHHHRMMHHTMHKTHEDKMLMKKDTL
jgi:hypothetical protein